MTVKLTHNGSIAIVTIDRQPALNALNLNIISEISTKIDEIEALGSRIVVFTGAGPKAFSAGADLKELESLDDASRRAAISFGQKTFAKLDTLPAISIAAIHGFALGGGLELALSCTFRVATSSGRFGLPESKLGLIPGYGGTQRLPKLVGTSRAAELIMSGRIIDAMEAERIGLVSAIHDDDDPVRAGLSFASRFANSSPTAVIFARDAIKASLDVSLHEGLAIEADIVSNAFRSSDAEEGISAFSEKRPPRFVDGLTSDLRLLLT